MSDTPHDGAAEVRRVSGWLGQITSHWPAETFAPGPVTVTLHDGDRHGWSAPAAVDTAGALRGDAAFSPGSPGQGPD